jgi:hypothetical protein
MGMNNGKGVAVKEAGKSPNNQRIEPGAQFITGIQWQDPRNPGIPYALHHFFIDGASHSYLMASPVKTGKQKSEVSQHTSGRGPDDLKNLDDDHSLLYISEISRFRNYLLFSPRSGRIIRTASKNENQGDLSHPLPGIPYHKAIFLFQTSP